MRYLLLPLLAFAAGCGGQGGSDAFRFPGHYTGSYASVSTEDDAHGTIDLVVADDGTLSGSVVDSRTTDGGTIASSSQISRRGTVVLSVIFGTGPAINRTSNGNLALDGTTLAGTLNEVQGDISEPFDYTLDRVVD